MRIRSKPAAALLVSTLLAAVACSQGDAPAAGPRPEASGPAAAPPREASRPADGGDGAEMAAAVRRFVAAIAPLEDAALPALGQPAFLEPPDEPQLAWINDGALPLTGRMERAMALYDDTRAILHRYAGRDTARAAADPARAVDSGESLRWSAAAVRLLGRISSALLDEFLAALPPDDPKRAARLQGLETMRAGAAGMLRGTLITLGARRADLAGRRGLAAAWRAHATRYAALWTAEQCGQLAPGLREVLAAEQDPELRTHLEELSARLASCSGAAR